MPDVIYSLVQIHKLNLSHNQITSLPEIGRLHGLRDLNLSNNQLSTLPQGIIDLARERMLYKLTLLNNPLPETEKELRDKLDWDLRWPRLMPPYNKLPTEELAAYKDQLTFRHGQDLEFKNMQQ